jgi:alpha-1,3-rhamnosyltransferase
MTPKAGNSPLVSIIVPCYNHEKYISDCIESIVNQTYKNFELTVIDDGSVDQSFAVLINLQEKYRFNLIKQENRGVSATLNRGIKEFSKGKYICFCASDDFWRPEKLEKQINFMEKNPALPMCYGKTEYIDGNSNPVAGVDKGLRGGWLFDDLFTFKIHPPVNYMFRATIFKEVGGYDEAIAAEDYYMNLKIARMYQIGYLDEYLSFYRIDFTPTKIERINKILDSHLRVIEDYKMHRLYKNAKNRVYLNKLDWLSGFKVSKKIAMKNLIYAFPMIFNKRYWAAVIKLFLFWQ